MFAYICAASRKNVIENRSEIKFLVFSVSTPRPERSENTPSPLPAVSQSHKAPWGVCNQRLATPPLHPVVASIVCQKKNLPKPIHKMKLLLLLFLLPFYGRKPVWKERVHRTPVEPLGSWKE